ncbi:hypothetical protein ACQ33O_02820 [Ferruginibacter sp. SUN002]|uniref:hypothetical protein n=1 Tax=Ferruginibacter sp. SUN002 TaxID=2937789 RepID=UPI003D365D60
MVFVANATFAQELTHISGKILLANYSYDIASVRLSPQTSIVGTSKRVNVIPADFYYTNLGFFCKQEIKIEKATKISLKFRLGSVESCDRLEGKFRYN